MRHKVTFGKLLTLSPYTQVRERMTTNISEFIHKELNNFQWTKLLMRWANQIYGVVANKPIEIIVTSSAVIEKKLCEKMIISYAKRSSDFHLAVIDTMVVGIFESLKLMVD